MRSAFSLILCSAFLAVVGTSTSAIAQQKTARECVAEWRAHKAENQAKGITESAYVAQCRAGTPGAPTTAAPVPSTPSQATTAATPSSSAAPAATPPTGANQFAAEGQAKAHCPSDTVVWANLSSKIYHFSGYKDYGHTKRGAYMCERDAAAQGLRAAKNEKHPS